MLVTANIFQPLIDIFEAVLKLFHNSLGVPWGWSIVLLTVVIRAVMVPLTLKQFHSMRKLQQLQPEMKALQAKYKDDKKRQQEEMMKFYKENQVNPFSSCLPLALQLPVFISLFYMLRQDLRKNICPDVQSAALAAHKIKVGQTVACGPHHGAAFLFINDLTNSAHGIVLVVLIVLYVGTQLGSTLMMSAPTMDKTQRQLMMAMPLFFVFFILSFPAGVIVYWITTNGWTILQQYVVRRRLGPVGPPPGAAVGDGAAVVGPSVTRSGGGGSGAKKKAPEPPPESNGSGGIGELIRNRIKPEAPAVVAPSARDRRGGSPPPSPRKKKKRSGRRR